MKTTQISIYKFVAALYILFTIIYSIDSFGQVGINTTVPNASSMLDITSTNKGLLIPRMTSAQRLAIATPATGLMVYETTTNQFFYFDGLVWKPLAIGNTGWGITGNSGTAAGANFIGTTDSVDWVVKTKNTERMRVKANGKVFIGNATAGFSPIGNAALDVATTSDSLVYRGRNNSNSGTITQIGSIEWFKDFANTIDFNNNNNSAQLSINFNNNAAHDLQLKFDDAAKPGTNTWTISSDARLKTDVHSFKDGLETLGKINPVYYQYNGKANTPQGEYFIGVLAQDLQKATPYMVGSFEYTPDAKNTDVREEYLSVNNGALTYVLVNSVKELDEKTNKMASAIRTITDFGMEQINSGNEIRVNFEAEFSSSIQEGKLPVVTVSAVNSPVSVFVKEITATGFTIVAPENSQGLNINWIAAAKIRTEKLNTTKIYTPEERSDLISKVKMKKATIRMAEENAEMAKRKLSNDVR